MTSHPPGARGRALIPLLVVLLGVALGAGGVMLLRSSGTSSTPGAAGPAQPPVPARAGHDAVRPLGNQVIYQRVEPSVVDVTSTLRYDAETASGTGFVISGAEDGLEALARIDRGEVVDILLTDFAMPGMNGVELISAARHRRPRLPAILLTGHMGDVSAAVAGGAEAGQFILLRKPVRPAELTARLSAALAETAA